MGLRHHTSFITLSILLLGCEPPPESVGHGLSTSTGDEGSSGQPPSDDPADGGSSGAEATGGEVDVEPEWELRIPGGSCKEIAGMPDGGVIAVIGSDTPPHNEIHRYGPDGTLLWQQGTGPLYASLDTLPDGRIVLGGSVAGDFSEGGLWLLSAEGETLASQILPFPDDGELHGLTVFDLDATEDGVAFSVFDVGDPPYTLSWAALDLVPQWSTSDFDASPTSIQVQDDGIIRVLINEIETLDSRVRRFAADGTPLTTQPQQGRTAFASGDPGALVGWLGQSMELRGLEELPGLYYAPDEHHGGLPVASHRDGFVLSGWVDDGTRLWVQRLDADANLVFEHTRAPAFGDSVWVEGVEVTIDGAAYVCGQDVVAATLEREAFLLRLPAVP